jgi:hypothetical protein
MAGAEAGQRGVIDLRPPFVRDGERAPVVRPPHLKRAEDWRKQLVNVRKRRHLFLVR